MTKEDILKKCTVEGLVVKLPPITLDRKLYLEVAKSLELIGGKWKGGKISGFIFKEDPSELLNQIATEKKIDLKKEYQFFGTPEKLADYLVEIAEISDDDEILEPSAGQGAIVNAINKVLPNTVVNCYELMKINQTILNKIPNVNLLGDDFLKARNNHFDKIIANPPFSKNQDIKHIYKMYECLSTGGRIVTVASTHWLHSTNKKEMEFKEWLDKVGGKIYDDIETGTFKESGTNISALIIVINK